MSPRKTRSPRAARKKKNKTRPAKPPPLKKKTAKATQVKTATKPGQPARQTKTLKPATQPQPPNHPQSLATNKQRLTIPTVANQQRRSPKPTGPCLKLPQTPKRPDSSWPKTATEEVVKC